jgi:hypothetical protein
MAKPTMKLAVSQIMAEKRKKSSMSRPEAIKIAAKELPKSGKKK